MLALLLQQLLLSSWIEQRKSRAHSTLTAVAVDLRMYELPNQYLKKLVRAPAGSTAVKNVLDDSTRNGKFKRLEPHFQLSAMKSASKEGTETAVASPYSRECTKEPTSACQIMVQWKS